MDMTLLISSATTLLATDRSSYLPSPQLGASSTGVSPALSTDDQFLQGYKKWLEEKGER